MRRLVSSTVAWVLLQTGLHREAGGRRHGAGAGLHGAAAGARGGRAATPAAARLGGAAAAGPRPRRRLRALPGRPRRAQVSIINSAYSKFYSSRLRRDLTTKIETSSQTGIYMSRITTSICIRYLL